MSIYERVVGKLNRLWIHLLIFLYNLRRGWFGPMSLRSQMKFSTPSENFETIYSTHKREIEILPADSGLEEVIFSCYFLHKADPQHGTIRSIPDIEYIAPWYRSIEKIGVTGIIIHDGIDSDFIARYQTDKIRFRKYTPGNYSIFEERWFAYYLFLSKSNIKKAFFTDINDVYVTKNPFPVITNYLTLYVGKDDSNKVKDSGWMLAELADFEQDSNSKAPLLYPYQFVYNAGVIGGFREILLFLISRVINFVLLTSSGTHKDMTILNLCIHQHFFPPIDTNLNNSQLSTKEDDKRASHEYLVTGYPLNSEFKKYQTKSDAYFIHK